MPSWLPARSVQTAFAEAAQTPQRVYERIELPRIKPDIDARCVCSAAAASVAASGLSAEAPAGLEPGSPFGQSIAALVVYLHYAHRHRHGTADQR